MTHEQAPEEATDVLSFNYTSSEDQVVVPRDVKLIQVLPSVTEIPEGAFADCSELEEIHFGHGENTSLLRRIGNFAFMNCKSLSKIIIPKTVGFIGFGAFRQCSSLEIVELPEELKELGRGAFFGCSSLTTIRLPNSLIKIGPSAWKKCSQLRQIELSSSLEEIPDEAFRWCFSLQNIVFPTCVRVIGSKAVSDCHSLLQLHLPEGLRKIDSYAFRQCQRLGIVRIPSTVVEIGKDAFARCYALESVEFANGNLQVLDRTAFRECKTLFHLALPTCIPTKISDCAFIDELATHAHRRGSSFSTRFNELPVHNLCYLQVHRPLSETLEEIHRLEEASFASSKHFDFCEMTPFHIVALSSRPDPLFFDALMSKYPQYLWNHQDVAKKTTAMTFLLGNRAPESSAAIQHVVSSVLHDRIARLGLNDWRIQVQDMVHETSSAQVSERVQLFDQMIHTFRLMEQKENLSNLELAVWKMKISMTPSFEAANDMESNTSLLRERCRISCGAEIVVRHVLSYMDERNAIELFGL